MTEKIEELYQEYLKEKLDLIFEIEFAPNPISKRFDEKIKYNFTNRKGEVISNIWFDAVEKFHDGFACVKDHGRVLSYNFVDTNGKLISDNWYWDARSFCEGCACVKYDAFGEWKFINTNGKLMSYQWVDEIGNFNSGYAIVRNNHKFNFIDSHGKIISDIWFDLMGDFENGFALVGQKGQYCYQYNYININGKLISNTWFDRQDIGIVYNITKNFIMSNGKVICRKIEMGDYEVKKNLFGYTCKNSVDSYKVKYMPIKRYGLRYTLCLNHGKVLLYDRTNNQYTYEWKYEDIEYDNNFLFDKQNNKVYFIYENQMIEITDYYNKYLKDQNISKVNSGITEIISREEFSFLNRDKIDELFKEKK